MSERNIDKSKDMEGKLETRREFLRTNLGKIIAGAAIVGGLNRSAKAYQYHNDVVMHTNTHDNCGEPAHSNHYNHGNHMNNITHVNHINHNNQSSHENFFHTDRTPGGWTIEYHVDRIWHLDFTYHTNDGS